MFIVSLLRGCGVEGCLIYDVSALVSSAHGIIGRTVALYIFDFVSSEFVIINSYQTVTHLPIKLPCPYFLSVQPVRIEKKCVQHDVPLTANWLSRP